MGRFIKDVKRYWKYVIYAGQTELRAEVADSYLNWLWWIIEPLCFMLIYTFVFGYLFGNKQEYFPCFVFVGVAFWGFFSHMANSCVKLVKNQKSIVSRVYIPKYMLVFIKLYVNAFKLMIQMGLLAVLMICQGVAFTSKIIWAVPAIITLFTFTFGGCCILLHFGVYVDDLANVTRIFLQMMFYLTGVFYNLEEKLATKIGKTYAGWFGHMNPVASMMKTMRDSVIYAKTPDARFPVYWFIIGLVISAFGIALIYKNENNYVKVI